MVFRYLARYTVSNQFPPLVALNPKILLASTPRYRSLTVITNYLYYSISRNDTGIGTDVRLYNDRFAGGPSLLS